MLWRQSELERLPSSILHFRGDSKGTSRASHGSGADSSGTSEQIRAAPVESSILRLQGRLERLFRASCGAGPGSGGHFASQLRLRARLERPFREPAATPGQARAAISSWLRLRARLEQPFRANSSSGPGSMSQTSAGTMFSSQGGVFLVSRLFGFEVT